MHRRRPRESPAPETQPDIDEGRLMLLRKPKAEPDFRSQPMMKFDYSLSPPPDGDAKAVADATARQMAAYARRMEERARQMAAVEELRERWRAALKKHVGADHWQAMRAFVRRHREELAAAGPRGQAELKKQAWEESLKLLDRAGTSPDEIKRVSLVFKQDLDRLLSPALSGKSQLDVVPLDHVPNDIIAMSSSALSVFEPPFAGWWWHWNFFHSGGEVPTAETYTDSGLGSIGIRSDWADHDASDIDIGCVTADTQLDLWYKPPSTGFLDIWITTTCASADSSIWLENEFGWSDSRTQMHSNFTVNVSPVQADEDRHEMWQVDLDTDDDGTWNDEHYPPANVQWVHMTTSQPVMAGLWTLVKVGTFDNRYTFLNDMSTSQMMRNRWFVNGVIVKMA
jgi:hypothetical protein